ncbi:uroporphyrinogen-III synthase [Streptomyces cinnamoneus]|uniref:Uroporphyrinogen-III synthase n=1 Tax=Streptomyces cinnamoneus TaxID=53446 RepID=A0A2G1XNY6_STRCJ|nr:uroporphyrinogen-III synthase [Streptomyces cinnamoneus]PHQ52869.1 uroporphyrinogen-III synthase [Streptomyces cinnamoneus]PPT11471.1 uroporphyrinogen-III synthase [Streptomyces cinnamoneus]
MCTASTTPAPVREGPGPLTGFTIGLTAARRREELVALLERRGARVVEAPTVRIVPLEDDDALRRATRSCLDAPLDYVVATTGVGWRGWMSAAEGWGDGGALLAACRQATVVSRGPKATGAVRASGLHEAFSPGTEASQEVLAWLLGRDLRGRRVAVQEHGAPMEAFAAALRERGAEVITAPVYRWSPPRDAQAVRRLVEAAVHQEVQALAFTSAVAAVALLETAAAAGRREELLAALRTGVTAACVGDLCAQPLLEAGVPVHRPPRARLGALVRTLTEVLPRHGRWGRRPLRSGPHPLVLQGNALLGDGDPVWLPPLPAAVLRALAERPGHVLSRGELLSRAWPGDHADEHAVEMAVTRLRKVLGPHAGLVRTVPKRGYRLADAS